MLRKEIIKIAAKPDELECVANLTAGMDNPADCNSCVWCQVKMIGYDLVSTSRFDSWVEPTIDQEHDRTGQETPN